MTGISDAPTSSPASPFATFSYGRDGNDQVSSVTSTGVPSDSHSYGYSALNQLRTVDAASYGYDAADNLTGLADGTSQAFDIANQLAATGGVSLVGTAGAGGASTNSLTIPLPAGTSANDQVLVAATLPYGKTVSTPTGYTAVGTYTSGTSSTSAKVVVWRRTAVAGDTSVAVSFTGKFDKAVTVAVYRGVSTASPIDSSSAGSAAGGTSVTAPSVTTTLPAGRLVMLQGAVTAPAAGTWSPPASMTMRVQQASGTSIGAAVADQALGAAGPTGTRTAAYSQNAQLVGVLLALKPAQTSYGYDSRGNRTSVTPPTGSVVALGYDQANRLTSYGASATYRYDGDGLRMSKTVSGSTTNFTWDVSGGLPLVLDDGSSSYVYGPGGAPIEQVSSTGVVTYLYQDQLGSTRVLASAAGAVSGTFSYDAYGRQTGSTGTASSPLGWAGEYRDAESGLVYLRARSYDPGTGQFLTRDPLAAVTGSPYGYAGGDPVDATDPLGLCKKLKGIFGRVRDTACNAGDAASSAEQFVADHAGDIALGTVAVGGTVCALSVACGVAVVGALGPTALAAAAGLGTAGAFASFMGAAPRLSSLSSEATFVGEVSGPASVIPEGAVGPTPTANGAGIQFTGGCGGLGLDSRVAGLRVMDPNALNPNGYISYFNDLGQTVDPFTGRTIDSKNLLWHIPR